MLTSWPLRAQSKLQEQRRSDRAEGLPQCGLAGRSLRLCYHFRGSLEMGWGVGTGFSTSSLKRGHCRVWAWSPVHRPGWPASEPLESQVPAGVFISSGDRRQCPGSVAGSRLLCPKPQHVDRNGILSFSCPPPLPTSHPRAQWGWRGPCARACSCSVLGSGFAVHAQGLSSILQPWGWARQETGQHWLPFLGRRHISPDASRETS